MELRMLNIAIDYPVKWTKALVVNNFIQNFYDAIGPDDFFSSFHVSYSNRTIFMKSDKVFSKEWLYYTGASTKRDNDGYYAGRYGEGFKIAALTAYRDMGLGVRMESKDWVMTVTEGERFVDGKKKRFLTYEIETRDYEDNSVLTLTGADNELFKQINTEMTHFFSKNNPLFGTLVESGEEYAVYLPNSSIRNENYGGVFMNRQCRFTFDYPIFICNHNYNFNRDDRDRIRITHREILEAICEVVRELSGFSCYIILEAFRPLWSDYKDKNHYSWRPVIHELIMSVRDDFDVNREFLSEYENKLIAKAARYYSPKRDIAYAKSWLNHSEYSNRRMVGSYFKLIGIKDIVSFCRDHGGFNIYKDPDTHEIERIKILEEIAERLFSDICIYNSLPTCRIITGFSKTLNGQAICTKKTKIIRNKYGFAVRMDIKEVNIHQDIINGTSLFCALPVYLHELLHQYGSDESAVFHKALYEMSRIILEKNREISQYEGKWHETGRYQA